MANRGTQGCRWACKKMWEGARGHIGAYKGYMWSNRGTCDQRETFRACSGTQMEK